MISKKTARKYKEIIGFNYAQKILDYFEEKGFTRDSGESYHKSDIRNIMTGQRYSLSLELYILEVVEHYQELAARAKERKERVLNGTKNPG